MTPAADRRPLSRWHSNLRGPPALGFEYQEMLCLLQAKLPSQDPPLILCIMVRELVMESRLSNDQAAVLPPKFRYQLVTFMALLCTITWHDAGRLLASRASPVKVCASSSRAPPSNDWTGGT